jgi:hypothetical protein
MAAWNSAFWLPALHHDQFSRASPHHCFGNVVMENSPKVDSENQPLDPPPQDPFEAKEAIEKGQVAPIASYLRYDVREILNLLADKLDDGKGDESPDMPAKSSLL